MPRLSGRNSSDINMSFVPQKRPCTSSLQKDVKLYKKTKKKHKIRQKSISRDIYKVEFVNSDTSNLTNDLNDDSINSNKPPVIIRLKRIKRSKMKKFPSDTNYHNVTSDNHRNIPIPVYRHIPVVRKQSFSNQTEVVSSKKASNNHIFTFEQPRLNQNNFNTYFPTSTCIPYTKPYVGHIKDKIIELEKRSFMCTLSLKESIQIISNMELQKIGEWFYNTPTKIQDELSFDSNTLVPFTELSKQTQIDSQADSQTEDEWFN